MRPVLALVVLLVGGTTFAADDEKYVSKEGKFTIVFPAGQVKENTIKSGAITSKQSLLDVKDRTFEVIYADLPADAKALTTKQLFDAGEKGAMKGDKKLVASMDFTFGTDKLPARELLVKGGTRADRAVMILKGDRFYVLTMSGPDNFTTAKEAYAFFETFNFTK